MTTGNLKNQEILTLLLLDMHTDSWFVGCSFNPVCILNVVYVYCWKTQLLTSIDTLDVNWFTSGVCFTKQRGLCSRPRYVYLFVVSLYLYILPHSILKQHWSLISIANLVKYLTIVRELCFGPAGLPSSSGTLHARHRLAGRRRGGSRPTTRTQIFSPSLYLLFPTLLYDIWFLVHRSSGKPCPVHNRQT